MRKGICLVLLRLLPKGGSKFRCWFAAQVCRYAFDDTTRMLRTKRYWFMCMFASNRSSEQYFAVRDELRERVHRFVPKFGDMKLAHTACSPEGRLWCWRRVYDAVYPVHWYPMSHKTLCKRRRIQMKKTVALCLLRLIPRGGSTFRVWLCNGVCRQAFELQTFDLVSDAMTCSFVSLQARFYNVAVINAIPRIVPLWNDSMHDPTRLCYLQNVCWCGTGKRWTWMSFKIPGVVDAAEFSRLYMPAMHQRDFSRCARK